MLALLRLSGTEMSFLGVLGPVPQSPIKLILGLWKILIAICLPFKKDFSQD